MSDHVCIPTGQQESALSFFHSRIFFGFHDILPAIFEEHVLMADPLSLSASILAVVGAAVAVVKTIRRIHQIPRQLQELAVELESVVAILREIEAARMYDGVTSVTGFAQHVDEACKHTVEVEELLKICKLPTNGVKTKNVLWIQQLRNVKWLTEEVKRTKEILSRDIGILTLYVISIAFEFLILIIFLASS